MVKIGDIVKFHPFRNKSQEKIVESGTVTAMPGGAILVMEKEEKLENNTIEIDSRYRRNLNELL